jgi:hypothetical protein
MAATRRRGPKPALSLRIRYPSNADIDAGARAAFIRQLTSAAAAGKDITVVAPTAGNKDGRAKLTLALRAEGVAPEVTAVLGWDTTDGEVPVETRRREPAVEADRVRLALEASRPDPATLEDIVA